MKELISRIRQKARRRVEISFGLLICTWIVIINAYVGRTNYSGILTWDSWDVLAPIYNEISNLNLTLGNIFDPHNGHPLFLTNILLIVNSIVFGKNFVFLLFMNYFLTLCVLLLFIRIQQLGSKSSSFLVYVPIVVFVFSNQQWENFLGPLQSQEALVNLMPLASLYFWASFKGNRNSKQLIGAILFAALSAVTMSNGVLFFVATLFLYRKDLDKRVAKTIVIAGLILALIISTVSRNHEIDYFSSFQNLSGFFKYLSILLSFPIIGNISKSIPALSILVLIAVCTAAAILIRKLYKDFKSEKEINYFFVISVIFFFFQLITTAGIAWTRLPIGIEAATSSRYTSVTLTMYTALYLALLMGKFSYIPVNLIRITAVFFVISICLQQTDKALISLNKRSQERFAMFSVANGFHNPADLREIYPVTDRLLELAQSYGYDREWSHSNQKKETNLNSEESSKCKWNISLDEVPETNGFRYRIRGWVEGDSIVEGSYTIDSATKKGIHSVGLVLISRIYGIGGISTLLSSRYSYIDGFAELDSGIFVKLNRSCTIKT